MADVFEPFMMQYWIWLSQCKNFSKTGLRLFLDSGLSPEELFSASPEELRDLGFADKDVSALLQRNLAFAQQSLELCDRFGIHCLTPQDSAYPESLLALDRPPLVLYYSGRLPDFTSVLTIAMVGHRLAADSSRFLARTLSEELAKNGVIIVSGGAEGIDSEAIQGALKGNGIPVCILGCGVDVCYPACNRRLFSEVTERGCLISEYPPHTPPAKWNFPERNRLISALSHGVVVVEASRKSGSMITASFALEQGKDLFSVPGTAGAERFSGTNDLLRQGAYFTENAEDILSVYRSRFEFHDPSREENRPAPEKVDDSGLDRNQALLLSLMSELPLSVDDLTVQSHMDAASVTCALTMLQIYGKIRSVAGGGFVRIT